MRISLDVLKREFNRLECKQGDDLTFEIELYKEGQPYILTNVTPTLNLSNSLNQAVIQTQGITKKDNVLTIQLLRDATRVQGDVKAEIKLVEGDKQKYSFTFVLAVYESVLQNANVQPSIMVDIVEVLQNTVNEAIKCKEETEQLIKSGNAATKGDIQNLTSQLDSIVEHCTGGNGMQEHSHANKNVIDKITETNITEWNNINVVEEEIDKINDNIDYFHNLQYVPFAGTNGKSDYALAGTVKDISIKGRTLHNLMVNCVDENCLNTYKHWGVVAENTFEVEANGSLKYLFLKKENMLLKNSTKYTIILDVLENTIVSVEGSSSVFTIFGSSGAFIGGETLPVKDLPNRRIFLKTTREDIGVASHGLDSYLDNRAISGKLKIRLMILEGDYTNTPLSELPYIEGIQGVGEEVENGYDVEVKSCGKNLFDINDIKIESDITYLPITKQMIDKKLALSFSKQIWIKISDKKYGEAYYESSTFRNGIFNFTANQVGLKIMFFKVGFNKLETIGELLGYSPQLEEASTPTPYEPYVEDTLTYTLEEQLHKLPNGVCDEIKDGKLIRRVGKVVLNGSESSWAKYDISNIESNPYRDVTTCYYVATPSNAKLANGGACDKFNNAARCWDLYGKGYYSHHTISPYIYFNADKSLLPDLASFKAWLQANPTTVYYELKTPIIKELDKPTNLDTYIGTTHITSSNTVLPTIEGKIRTDLASALAGAKAESQALNIRTMNLEVENEELKSVNNIQDELIDVSMMATDELYNMIEPMLPQTMNKTLLESEVRSPMVDMYVAMVQRGLKTIEEVPSRYRESVAKILAQLDN